MREGVAMKEFILKVMCVNRAGIVAAVSSCIADNGGDILESAQFDDDETERFVMRLHFRAPDGEPISLGLEDVARKLELGFELIPADRRHRVLIMVSKFDHCLHDLLYRWRNGTLDMDIVGVVSNHETARGLVEFYGLPFHHLPVAADTKPQQEAELLALIERERVDLVVLARYMQILSDDLSRRLHGKVINIHHSFLPSFKGAKPYHKAHARGVKLIGATAHYVTPELDEGPIIEQDVARVKHSQSAEDYVRIGQEIESRVLARAIRWHLDHRVFLNGPKTIVFD